MSDGHHHAPAMPASDVDLALALAAEADALGAEATGLRMRADLLDHRRQLILNAADRLANQDEGRV